MSAGEGRFSLAFEFRVRIEIRLRELENRSLSDWNAGKSKRVSLLPDFDPRTSAQQSELTH